MFIEILFKMLLFKEGVLIYAEHCILKSKIFVVEMLKINILSSSENLESRC